VCGEAVISRSSGVEHLDEWTEDNGVSWSESDSEPIEEAVDEVNDLARVARPRVGVVASYPTEARIELISSLMPSYSDVR
jgi:hypothetical protein